MDNYFYSLLLGLLLVIILDKPLKVAIILGIAKEAIDLAIGANVELLEFIALIAIPLIVSYRHLWVIAFVCLIAHNPIHAQYEWKKKLPTMGLYYVSGAGDGFAEKLKHHYWKFKAQFPNANDNIWNPDLSWKNKWKVDANGNVIYPLQERFPLSSTALSLATDPYHGARFISRSSASVGTVIWLGHKQPWWHYAIDVALLTFFRNLGFHTTYR